MQNNIDNIKQNLDKISQIITKTVPVESIYLFGSFAYGTPSKDSDLDLYVAFKDELPMREIDAITAISITINSVKNAYGYIRVKTKSFS
jgi:predicted nucleotidyltransferase